MTKTSIGSFYILIYTTSSSIFTMNNQFQKRVLIPFWILQILFLLIVVGTYAVVLWAFDSYNDDHPSTGNLLDAAM